MTLALSSGATVAWWIALGVGLVVAIVVWVLLEILRRTVVDVKIGVDAVLGAGGRLAQNTATTHLLTTTKARGVDLLEELGHHRRTERS